MIILDTNVVSELWKIAPNPKVQVWANAQAIETLYLPTVTVAELDHARDHSEKMRSLRLAVGMHHPVGRARRMTSVNSPVMASIGAMRLLLPALRRFGLWQQDRGARDARAIAASGLFDASYYYLNGGDDVAAAGADPIRHFCDHGWREGRRPNLFFDPLWYATSHLGAARDENPLHHYLREGERAGLKPICFFDPAWYRKTYGLAKGDSALAHYLAHRRTQRFAPNPDFDIAFYLDRHRDEIGRNRDPFMHHLRNGAALRDLAPSPHFDPAAYRREVMASDRRTWVGLRSHEMRVPLVHRLYGVGTQRDV